LRRLLTSSAVVFVASLVVAAHAQQQTHSNAPPAQGLTSTVRVRLPPAFAGVMGETATIQGHTAAKRDLLAQLDPNAKVTLPNGRAMTTQQLLDGVGRSEDKARGAGTSLRAIPTRRMAMVNPGPRIALQKQKLEAAKARLLAAKSSGWTSAFVERPSPGPSPSPSQLVTQMSLPHHHGGVYHRLMPVCAQYPGHTPDCIPDFSSISAPPWSQDVGDPSVVGGTTSFSLSGSTTPDGDQSTCSLEWDNVGQVFGTSWDILRVSASETTRAKSATFTGSLAIYVAGAAIAVPDDGAGGDDGTLMNETYSVSAGGKIPLVGPIYLELALSASASMQIALVGERRVVVGDPSPGPSAPVSGGGSGNSHAAPLGKTSPSTITPVLQGSHGPHCHVGVEPGVQSDVQLTTGIGFGIDDLVDLMHIEVTGDIKPITASMPTHVTLDLQRAPPSGQVAFDSHLDAKFMQSQLSFDWQIFDVCWTNPLGTICLLHDILQIPTSGSVVIAQDEGFDPLSIDLAGGGRAIRWKPKSG